VRVVWTPEAEQDRDDLWDYIATDNVAAAARMDEVFSDGVAQLADFPLMVGPEKSPARVSWYCTKAIARCMRSKAKPSGCWHWFTPRAGGRRSVISQGKQERTGWAGHRQRAGNRRRG